MSTRTRIQTISAVAGLLSLSAAGAAFGQASTTVTATVGESTRQLTVVDLLGAPLTDLTLTPGSPSPFQLRVSDTGLGLSAFSVNGTLNNLYRVEADTSLDYTSLIPSSEVTLDYASDALNTLDNIATLSPDYLLSSIADIDCESVQTVLGLTNLETLTDQLCLLAGGLGGVTPVDVTDVPLDGSAITDIDLSSLVDSLLPISLDTADLTSGVFTDADCVNGLGSSDGGCGATGGTSHTMLRGQPVAGALTGALDTLLTAALPSGNIVGSVGDEVSTLTAVLSALQDSADTAISDLGQSLGEYAVADQEALVNTLFSVIPVDLDAASLLSTSGVYVSFPRLTVDPTTSLAGSYTGTLTVTLVE